MTSRSTPAGGLPCPTRWPIEGRTPAFDLEVHVGEEPGGLTCTFVYATDLFDAGTIVRMMGHYRTLLEGIVADANRRVSELAMLTEAERRQLLVDWNDTEVDYPRDLCVHQLFEAQVERSPDAVAVVFGDESLTYGALNRRANRLARRLRGMGVGPEVLVGLCVERSLEMVVGLLGILKAGGAYVPLDPAYPKERLAFMLEDTGARVVLTQESLRESLPEGQFERVRLDAPEILEADLKSGKPSRSLLRQARRIERSNDRLDLRLAGNRRRPDAGFLQPQLVHLYIEALRFVLLRYALDRSGGARELADSLYADLYGIKDAGRERQPAGQHGNPLRHQHGELQPARALRRAARPGGRRRGRNDAGMDSSKRRQHPARTNGGRGVERRGPVGSRAHLLGSSPRRRNPCGTRPAAAPTPSPDQPTRRRVGWDIPLCHKPSGQRGLGALAALAQRLIADPPVAGQVAQGDLLRAGGSDQLGVHP